MPRLTADQWADIRAKREGTGASFRELASQFGVSEAAICKKAKAEGWSDGQDGNELANRLAREKVNGIVNAVNPKKRAESIEAAADAKAGVIVAQQADWQLHRATFAQAHDDFDELKRAKIMAEMLKIRHEGERKAYNISDTDQQSSQHGGITVSFE